MKAVVPLHRGDHAIACPQGCDHALDNALITAPASARSGDLLAKLDAVAGRVLAKK